MREIAHPSTLAFHDPAETSPSWFKRLTGWATPSALVSLLAGALTAFTISLVGEMPLGELVLVATAGWAALCAALNRRVPGALFTSRWFLVMLACQLVALVAYIGSDLYRQSEPRDMARGWARMIFLGIDLIAITYLLSCSRKNLMFLIVGQALGEIVRTYTLGPLFGDFWKFGVGGPLTYGVLVVGSLGGPFLAMLGAAVMGVVHFLLDYRSVGAICVLLAALLAVQRLPRAVRLWALPLGLALALAGAMGVYQHTTEEAGGRRTTRSDVDRGSMIQAAVEAVVESPFIGHGSWFSNSDVYDNFLQIRSDAAKLAGIGGFVGPNAEVETTSIHSQILVALAEGGVFGGAFFLAFAYGLARTGWVLVLRSAWSFESATYLLLLLFGVTNLFFSPFSGAHRVYISMAAGLVLLVLTPPVRDPAPAVTATEGGV
jgi:hypothetical protein